MRISKAMIHKWIRVMWQDACDEKQTWMTEAEIDEGHVNVRSAGFVVRVSKQYLTLAGDVNFQPDTDEKFVYGRVTRIPIGMITDIQEEKA